MKIVKGWVTNSALPIIPLNRSGNVRINTQIVRFSPDPLPRKAKACRTTNAKRRNPRSDAEPFLKPSIVEDVFLDDEDDLLLDDFNVKMEDDDFQEIETNFVKADILGKPNWSMRVNSSNKSQKRKSPGAKEKGKLVLEDDGDPPVKKKQCQSIAKGRASKSIHKSESEIFYGSSHIKKKEKKISGGSPSSKKKKKVSKVKWKAVKLVENNNYPRPDLKMWEFYVHPDQHHSRKISTHTEEDAVKTIREKLGNELLERFRGTCFGHFIDMPKFTVQNQLLLALLLREVKNPPRDDALWFIINDKKLRFGLREFGLVTGLKCQGDHLKDYSSDEPNRLIQQYFDGVAKVTKSSLVKCFMQQKWQNDDDAIKLAALYFIHTFLFSTKNNKKNDTNILKSEFNLVESGEWETFPWGVKVFQATKSSMHNRFTKHSEMYRFAGFPYALQVWFYECCPTVHEKIAYRVEKTSPRILNWYVKKSYFFEELQNGIFKLENDQIILNNIFPTDMESLKFQLPQFSDLEVAIYERGNEFDVEPPMNREGGYLHESSPLQRSSPLKRNEQGKTGVEYNRDIKQIFAQQVELKNEMASLKQYLVSTVELILTKLGSTQRKGDDENGVPEQQGHENAIDDEDIAIQVDPPHIEEEKEEELLDDDDDGFIDEYLEEEAELFVGDGSGGGGILLAGASWDKKALELAEEIALSFDGELGIYAFKTLKNANIQVRVERLTNKSGSPSLMDIEAFTSRYREKLDEAEVAGSIPNNISLEVSSPGVERVVRIPEDLERFKDRPMYVKYVTEVAEGGSSSEHDGVLRLVSFNLETNACIWGLADVKVNREKAGKGRPLSKKQRDWRLETPFTSLRLVRLYSEI